MEQTLDLCTSAERKQYRGRTGVKDRDKRESLLGRQEDMEARFKVYLKVGRLQHCPTNKP
jgi:hypothetical protein